MSPDKQRNASPSLSKLLWGCWKRTWLVLSLLPLGTRRNRNSTADRDRSTEVPWGPSAAQTGVGGSHTAWSSGISTVVLLSYNPAHPALLQHG